MYFQRGNEICFWTPLWSSLLKYIWARKFVKNFKKSIKSIKRIWDNDSLHTCFESTLCRVRKHIVYQEPANKYEFIHPDRLVLGQKTGKSSKFILPRSYERACPNYWVPFSGRIILDCSQGPWFSWDGRSIMVPTLAKIVFRLIAKSSESYKVVQQPNRSDQIELPNSALIC